VIDKYANIKSVLAKMRHQNDYRLLQALQPMFLLINSEEIFIILNDAMDKARNRMNEMAKEMHSDA
jgi:hypothetical protein